MKKLIFGVFLAVCWCTGTVKAQDIAVKTNLLYWSSTTPNLSLEFGLGKRTTLDLTGAYNPWTLNKDKNKKIKHWMVMPEFRYGSANAITAISSACTAVTRSTTSVA